MFPTEQKLCPLVALGVCTAVLKNALKKKPNCHDKSYVSNFYCHDKSYLSNFPLPAYFEPRAFASKPGNIAEKTKALETFFASSELRSLPQDCSEAAICKIMR